MTHFGLVFESLLLLVLIATLWQAARLHRRLAVVRDEHAQLLGVLEQFDPQARGEELSAFSTLRSDLAGLLDRLERARAQAREEGERLGEQLRVARAEIEAATGGAHGSEWLREEALNGGSNGSAVAAPGPLPVKAGPDGGRSKAERELTRHLASLYRMAVADA